MIGLSCVLPQLHLPPTFFQVAPSWTIWLGSLILFLPFPTLCCRPKIVPFNYHQLKLGFLLNINNCTDLVLIVCSVTGISTIKNSLDHQFSPHLIPDIICLFTSWREKQQRQQQWLRKHKGLLQPTKYCSISWSKCYGKVWSTLHKKCYKPSNQVPIHGR